MTITATQTEAIYSPLAFDPDLSDILDLFVSELPGRIAILLEQLERRQWEELRRAAHQLKGAGGSYGFPPITQWAGQLENALRQGRPEEEIRGAVEALADLCRRIRSGRPD